MKIEFKNSHNSKKAKEKQYKPLFPYGDWVTIILGVIILSQMDGMGHHLGHAGVFCLMLALIARPINFLWSQPLNHRRTIGILSFATALAHAIYAFEHALHGNIETIFAMASIHKWGVLAGVISLAAITPAAVTSFQFFQRKLGKKWRQIHLLSVPALALAVLHTVLIGPHYMAKLPIEFLDHLRIYGIIAITLLVFLMRRQRFWFILGLKKIPNTTTRK